MIKNLIAIVVLFLATQLGFGMDILKKTYMCDTSNTIEVSGVTCCLDQFTESQCQQIIESELNDTTLMRTNEAIDMIIAEEFGYKANPNCHWNAMAYHFESFETNIEPFIDLKKYAEILEDRFIEVPYKAAKSGDIVVFYEYDIKEKMLVEINGKPKMKFVSISGENIFHSAVFLNDGIVFQKENVDSAIFSIANIDTVNQTYQTIANQKVSLKRSKVKYKIYRPLTSKLF